MNEPELFEALKEAALNEMGEISADDLTELSFCVMMFAGRPDGSAVGGAFIVDPALDEDMDAEKLVTDGSLASLTAFITMKQAQPIANRCLTAAATLKGLDPYKEKPDD
jgi:hypothetical protein